MIDRPLKITDKWCCHRKCPYIGRPYDENGKSSCIRCKTAYINKYPWMKEKAE